MIPYMIIVLKIIHNNDTIAMYRNAEEKVIFHN